MVSSQEQDELQKRLAGATPAAARAAAEERNRKYIVDNYWPKGRGPKHFRGLITDITGPHPRSGTFNEEFTEWEVMTVHFDPATLEIFEDNKENPQQAQYDVRLPKAGEDPSPDSEIILTVEAAQQLERSPIQNYFSFKGRVVEMVADVKELPKRSNQKYATRVWFYRPVFVGAAGSSEGLQEGASSVSATADAADMARLASFYVGKKATAVKRVDVLRFIGNNKPWVNEAALSSLVGNDEFLKRAVEDGLLEPDAEGVFFDPTAVEA